MAKPTRKRSHSKDQLDLLVDEIAPDEVLPRDLHRSDEPDAVPEPAPARDVAPSIEGTMPAPDGGVAQHPIHDEDLEDLEPDDYQRQLDEVEDVRLPRDAAADTEGGPDVEVRPKGPRRKT
jgi:hypothetical protein